MGFLKIQVNSASAAQLSGLSRTTFWRAKRRGYFCPRYHDAWVNRQAQPSEEFDFQQAQKLAAGVVASFKRRGYPFPPYMDFEDLQAECVAELWRVSGKPGAQMEIRGWKYKVMRNRLYQISKIVRGERDAARRFAPAHLEPEIVFNDRLSLLLAEARRNGVYAI